MASLHPTFLELDALDYYTTLTGRYTAASPADVARVMALAEALTDDDDDAEADDATQH